MLDHCMVWTKITAVDLHLEVTGTKTHKMELETTEYRLSFAHH